MMAIRVLLRQPLVVALLLLGALLTRALVPAGYMPVTAGGGVTLQPCSGTMPVPAVAPMHHAGMDHERSGHGGKPEAPSRTEQPCAFSGLAAPALGPTDPLLLLAALAFAFLLAISGAAIVLRLAPTRLRPPLRAPPLTA